MHIYTWYQAFPDLEVEKQYLLLYPSMPPGFLKDLNVWYLKFHIKKTNISILNFLLQELELGFGFEWNKGKQNTFLLAQRGTTIQLQQILHSFVQKAQHRNGLELL